MVDLGALYLETGDIPWVVGLSGGKDSTALTMHLLETMEQLPPPIRNQKRVFITCVNTLVEAPPVIDHVHKFIERLQLYIEDRGLPVEVVELTMPVDIIDLTSGYNKRAGDVRHLPGAKSHIEIQWISKLPKLDPLKKKCRLRVTGSISLRELRKDADWFEQTELLFSGAMPQ